MQSIEHNYRLINRQDRQTEPHYLCLAVVVVVCIMVVSKIPKLTLQKKTNIP